MQTAAQGSGGGSAGKPVAAAAAAEGLLGATRARRWPPLGIRSPGCESVATAPAIAAPLGLPARARSVLAAAPGLYPTKTLLRQP